MFCTRLTPELQTQPHIQGGAPWFCSLQRTTRAATSKLRISSEKKLRIKDVTEEEIGVGPDKEKKLCVWFTNDERGLVLNKTNNRTLRGAFGDNFTGWKGKIIVVYPTTDEFRGRMVPVLRVRIPPPKEGNGQTASCSEAEAVRAQRRHRRTQSCSTTS